MILENDDLTAMKAQKTVFISGYLPQATFLFLHEQGVEILFPTTSNVFTFKVGTIWEALFHVKQILLR